MEDSKELPQINSARLTKENYSSNWGHFCPNCGIEQDAFYIQDQKLVGWAEAPWENNSFHKDKDCATVCECSSCGDIYWFHFNLDQLKEIYRRHFQSP